MRFWVRLLRRPRVEAELDAELRDHVERQVADYIEAGLSEAEARRKVRLEFGGLDQIKELCRDVRGTRPIEELLQDLRYAARGFRKSPGFTAVAVLTLALGIGANMAVFALIDALLLRPLPVRDPQELVTLLRIQGGQPSESFSYPQVRHLAEQAEIFSALCGFNGDTFNVGPPDAMEPTGGVWVTGSYYATLGVSPLAGRLLAPEDDRAGATPAAVITDRYWARRFGRDAGAIGQALQIEGVPVTIVGVTPPEFSGAVVGEAADITLTINVRPQLQPESASFLGANARWLRILARPRRGVSQDELRARLGVNWAQWLQSQVSPTMSAAARARALSPTLDVRSGATGASSLRGQFREPLLASMALVSLVLLIACVNVANLLLARATIRRREIALRLAIGAGRGRILRQLLTESALLASAGAVLGVTIASIGGRALVGLMAGSQGGPDGPVGVALDLALNWRMLAFTIFVAGSTTVLFGIAPALRASMVAPVIALNAGSNRIADPRRWVASALVSAQVALSLLLLIGAGLFVRTLQNLRTLDRGFRHEDVLLVDIDASRSGYRGAALRAFNQDVLAFAERLPGVAIATASAVTPLQGGGISLPITVNGQRTGDGEMHFNNVGPRFFEALDTPVVLGREFTPRDTADGPGVAIVNEAFVRQHMPGGNPLGQRVAVTGARELQVVGVVKDAVYETLRDAPPPTVYAPLLQRGGGGMSLVLYAPGALAPVASAIRAEVQPKLGRQVRAYADADRAARRQPRAGAVAGERRERIWSARTGTRRGRPVWAAGVLGRAAHAGNRHSRGARSGPAGSAPADRARRRAHACARHRGWRSSGVGALALRVVDVVRVDARPTRRPSWAPWPH